MGYYPGSPPPSLTNASPIPHHCQTKDEVVEAIEEVQVEACLSASPGEYGNSTRLHGLSGGRRPPPRGPTRAQSAGRGRTKRCRSRTSVCKKSKTCQDEDEDKENKGQDTASLSHTHNTSLWLFGEGEGRERRLEGRGNSPHETAETLGEDPVPRRGVVNGDAFVGLALSSSCSRTWTPQSSEQRRWKGESVDAPQSRGSRCARTSCLEERAPRHEGSVGRPKSSTRPRAEVGGREKERGRTHQLRTTAFQSSRNSSGC